MRSEKGQQIFHLLECNLAKLWRWQLRHSSGQPLRTLLLSLFPSTLVGTRLELVPVGTRLELVPYRFRPLVCVEFRTF